MFDLTGKSALVTGASGGIGADIARALHAAGASVGLSGTRVEPLEALAAELGSRAHVLPAFDILVNNAGAIPGGRIDQIDDATWKKAWDLKVFGTIGLCREMLAAMQARGQGVIVNVIGMAGERPDANYLAGSGANAALMAMTRALGAASVEHGVRVVGVNPGLVATDRMVGLLRAKAANTMGDAERWSELVHGYPFGRPAHPGEIADMVCFLASARAAYVSGTIVTVDGGVAARGASF